MAFDPAAASQPTPAQPVPAPLPPAPPSPAWTIRRCSLADADALALIGAATFLETYAGWLPGQDIVLHCARNHAPASYREALSKPGAQAWLAEVRDAPVAYLLLTAPEMPAELVRPGDTELKRIYLLSRFHGHGLAAELLRPALAWAGEQGHARMLVGMHPENRRAAAFYRRHGFAEIGKRVFQVGENTYVDPVMARPLDSLTTSTSEPGSIPV